MINEKLNVLFQAMQKAKDVFDEELEKNDYDSSYFALNLAGFILTSEYEVWKKVELKDIFEEKEVK